MRALYIVVSSLVLLVACTAVFVVSGLGAADSTGGSAVLLAIGATLTVVGPMLAGSFLMWWPKDPRSADSRRYVVRLGATCAGIGLAGLACIVAWTLVSSAPAWIPVAAAALLVGFAAAAGASGDAIRRREEGKPQPPVEQWGLSRPEVLRWKRRVTVAILITVAVTSLGLAVVNAISPRDPWAWWTAVPLSLGSSLIAAGAASLSTVFRLQRPLRAALGDDLVLARRIRNVVLKRADDDLTDGERLRAVRWASVMRDYLPVQQVQSFLTFAGVTLIQIPQLFSPESRSAGPFRIVFGALLVLLLAAVPVMIRQRRRISDYVRRNEQLLTSSTSV